MEPNFGVALEHQRRKAIRYRRLVATHPDALGHLFRAEITLESMRLVQEYHCEGMVLARVKGQLA
jgi:hypothetical protein